MSAFSSLTFLFCTSPSLEANSKAQSEEERLLTPEEAAEVVDSGIKNEVNAKMAEFQKEYEDQNNERCVGLKEVTDSLLLPALLPIELANGDPSRLAGVFAYDYQTSELLTPLLDSNTTKSMKEAFSHLKVLPDQLLTFSYKVSNYMMVETTYPIFLEFNVELSQDSGTIHGIRYEPLFANRGLVAPFSPDRPIIKWNSDEMYLVGGDSPTSITMEFVAEPMIDNPSGLYAVEDTLEVFEDMREGFWVLDETANLIMGKLPVSDENGNLRRIVSVVGKEQKPYSINISQSPVRLRQYGPNGYNFTVNYSNGEKENIAFRPEGVLDGLVGGRKISITNELLGDGSNRMVPKEITVSKGHFSLTHATLSDWKTVTADAPPAIQELQEKLQRVEGDAREKLNNLYAKVTSGQELPAVTDAFSENEILTCESNARKALMIKYNAYLAAFNSDTELLSSTLSQSRQYLQDEDIDPVFFLYSLEYLTESTFTWAETDFATGFMASELTETYETLNERELKGHICRLALHGRSGFGLCAIDAYRKFSLTSEDSNWVDGIAQELMVSIESGHDFRAEVEYAHTRREILTAMNASIAATYAEN